MSSGTVCSGLRTNLDLSGIDYLGLERVLKRGTGQVIEQHDQAVFVHDSVSGAFLLGCENVDLGADILGWIPIGNMVIRECWSVFRRHIMVIRLQ